MYFFFRTFFSFIFYLNTLASHPGKMKIYYDLFNTDMDHDELMSDSFNFQEVFDGVGVEVKSSLTKKGGEKIDIGCGDAFGGAGEEEKADDKEEVVNDVLDTYKYQETNFTKKDYTTYIKGYMKKIKEYLEQNKPDRVQPFMKGAQEMVKWILANFDDFQFFLPESYDSENMIILAYVKEKNNDKATPTFVYFKDGLKFKEF